MVYSLSVSMRGDGSSMVGNDHTWGFFPSVSFLGYEAGEMAPVLQENYHAETAYGLWTLR